MENGKYRIDLKTAPAVLFPDHECLLSLTPTTSNATEVVTLKTEHEQKIHLIIVSEDLEYFNHIHPTESTKGYIVTTKFPFGGRFYLFADYVPAGEDHHAVNRLELDVQGAPPKAQVYNKQKLVSYSDSYSILLSPFHGAFSTGHTLIEGTLMKHGESTDPNGLDNYLGAKAHVVIISVDDKEYIHVHPEVENGNYKLHTSFKKAGVYRAWIQFKAEGKLHTVDYVIEVNNE
jgi:hypothetical protein